MSEFNYKDYIANNPLLNEALESMGTADEETMEYLQGLGKDKLIALEKQFVDMFDTLRGIRYDGSEQLSKGASEISQRIHNFITIFRQVIKDYPVPKDATLPLILAANLSPKPSSSVPSFLAIRWVSNLTIFCNPLLPYTLSACFCSSSVP